MQKLRIGIIGLGNIAKTHISQLLKVAECEITAVCDIDEVKLKNIGDWVKVPEEYRFTDYKDLINCDKVDAVEICTPNFLHTKMALDVVASGKPVNIEKPIDINHEVALPLADAIKENPVNNMMCFSYRFRPSVRFAKHLMEQNLIGEIINVNVEYLKDSAFYPGRRLEWRFVKELAGTGVLGDLGVHLVDMATFLIDDITEVCGNIGIVVKERKRLDSEEIAPVETDDYSTFMAKFKNGAYGTFNITRAAIGHANTIKYDIFGKNGVISFNLNNPDVINVCIGELDIECKNMRQLKVPAKYRLEQEQAFVNSCLGKRDIYHPVIEDGIRCQKILDAVLESSETKTWVEIK